MTFYHAPCAPFDRPFDRLMVLSIIEGLIALSNVEGLMALRNVEGLSLAPDPIVRFARNILCAQGYDE